MRAYLNFTRAGNIFEKGRLAVDVPDTASMRDIWQAANERLFTEYLVQSRDVSDEEYTFELLKIEKQDG